MKPRRNDSMQLANLGEFQRRYEPNFAWANALSIFGMLPGLRGFWPMSSISEAGTIYDMSGQLRVLSYNGNPLLTVDSLAPAMDFDGVGDYLSRADEAGLDILGTETSIARELRGLTIGGWFLMKTLESASPSPSASVSRSVSRSLSPSASPSVSPSVSRSVSPSASLSISRSASLSPSASQSRSPSASQSPSASVSRSVSPSASVSPSHGFVPGAYQVYSGKWNTTGDQRSYVLIHHDSDNAPHFRVSSLGTLATVFEVTGTTLTSAMKWYFLAGRFKPSEELAIFVNNDKSVNTTSIPASIYNSTASFIVGACNEGSSFNLYGEASLCFLCGAALPDAVIRALYHHSRALFGI